MFSSCADRFATTHWDEVMARCSPLYDQMANNLPVCVAGLFKFGGSRCVEFELCFDVEAFGFLFNRVRQATFAPRVDLIDFSA